MKRFQDLIAKIKKLPDDEDLDGSVHPTIVELEEVFKDFYYCGWIDGEHNAQAFSPSTCNIQFKNALSNFYQHNEIV
jgi:hypothetical protein